MRRFHAFPESVQITPESTGPGAELAALRGTGGGIEGAARAAWEDMCLLTRRPDEEVYRLRRRRGRVSDRLAYSR